MGRGRAKAKQTKVARDLKYRSYSTDFTSLERELRGDGSDEPQIVVEEVAEDDQYGDLAGRYGDDEDADESEPYRRIS